MSKPYHQVFAANFRYYLTLRHKTQMELARALNIGQSLVSKYWRGERLPRMENLDAICKYLDCSRADLLGVDPESTPISKTGDELLDQLLEIAAKSPPGAIKCAITFLETMNAYVEGLNGTKKAPSPGGTEEGK